MKAHSWLITMFLLTLLGYSNAQVMPVNFDEAHQKALAANPPDVKFTLRLKDEKTQFHQGEILRLELGFSSTRPKAYALDAATYDRSGRMEYETFFLDPSDSAVDPLRLHFEEGGMRGGLHTRPALKEEPYTLTLELNEWRRFDKPGDYRLYVVSHRVSNESGARKMHPVASNPISFTILPDDPAWSESALRDALQILDAKPSTGGVVHLPLPRVNLKEQASRTLRFLNTPEAAREMARRYGDKNHPGNFDFMLGILASSHRTIAMEELHRRIADPDEPISESFMSLLTRLARQLSRPESLLPFPDPQDTEKVADWQERAKKRGLQHAAITKEQWDILAAAFKEKRGTARPATLYTLANRDWRTTDGQGQGYLLPAPYAAELRASFAELEPEAKRNLLEYRWAAIKSPEMLPHLRRLLELNSEAFHLKELRDVAARRLWELSPAEARPLFLKEIASPSPRFSVKTLSLLPDATLPQANETLAKNLENWQLGNTDFDEVTALIERYATSAIAPRVKTVLLSRLGAWACEPQAAMLAYFLRVEPAFAKNTIQKVLASRETGCRYSLISNLARRKWRPEIEEIALTQINSSDSGMADDAITTLGKYGSPRVESALWKRLEAWHAQWKDRADEIEFHRSRQNPHQEQAMLESRMMIALSQSPAWLTDAAKLQKLKQLMVTEPGRRWIDPVLQKWNGKVSISYWPGELEEYTVAQYSLNSKEEFKRKLAQFPKGTVFVWSLNRTESENDKSLKEELQSFLALRGMTLEKQQPDKK